MYHQGRTREEAGPTVPLGKKQRGGGSHCTTREELERRGVPLYHQGRTREEVGPTVPLGKN